MPSSSRAEGVWPSSSKKDKVMTMVIFFHTSVESCGGDQAYLLMKEEVCPSSPKDARSMTMVIFPRSLVERCGGDHGISSKEEAVSSS